MTSIAVRQATSTRVLMVILIAAMTQSVVVGLHESVHALSCLMVGHRVVEYSALHVDCEPGDALSTPSKVVAGSAAIVNLLLGTVFYVVLRARPRLSHNALWFLWLLMLANWSNGFGYLIFSGLSGAGDYATVIAGWEPAAVWQVGMLLVGAVLWLGSIWLALRVLGQIFGGYDKGEMRRRFLGLSVPSYFGAVLMPLLAGLFNTYGFAGLPSVAGIMAAAGTLSPLLWMPFWFVADSFPKRQGEPLTVNFDLKWAGAAVVICLVYVVVLGPGLTFASA